MINLKMLRRQAVVPQCCAALVDIIQESHFLLFKLSDKKNDTV